MGVQGEQGGWARLGRVVGGWRHCVGGLGLGLGQPQV